MSYFDNLNRIEFIVTLACTGRCKHCSEGEHSGKGEFIDGDIAAKAVYQLCEQFQINSLMTFGGEPLLHADVVYKIHAVAKECSIPNRQIITNGFFSKDNSRIKEVAEKLAECGVNDLLLSVDAFHQEAIPLPPVMEFAKAVKNFGVPLRLHPAWLGGKEAVNPYNLRTKEILREFEAIGIPCSEGNDIFPSGNALKYLSEYFEPGKEYVNPYEDDFDDIWTVCFSPNGDVLGGNIYQNDIMKIMEQYSPELMKKKGD